MQEKTNWKKSSKNTINSQKKIGNLGFVGKLMKEFKLKSTNSKVSNSTNKVFTPDLHGYLLHTNTPGKIKKTGNKIVYDSLWSGKNKMLPACSNEQTFEKTRVNNKPNKNSIKLPRPTYHDIKFKVYPKIGYFPIGHKKDKNFKKLSLPTTVQREKCWKKRSQISPWLLGNKSSLNGQCVNDTHCNKNLVCGNSLKGFKRGKCIRKVSKSTSGLKNGEPCINNSNCSSKKCLKNITGLGKGKCITMGVIDGQPCKYDYQCKNKSCTGNTLGLGKGTCKKMKILSGKSKKGTSKKGEDCKESTDCISGKCIGSNYGFSSGKCK